MSNNYTQWPDGWPEGQHYPGKPVYHILEQTVKRVPNRLALVFGGMELTYAEFKGLADRFAAALLDLGIKKGDRVMIHLINCPQFAIAYYGILKIGAVFSPLSPMLAPNEAEHQLNDAGAETLISLDLLFPGIEPIISATKVKRVILTSIADCYTPVISPLKPLGKTTLPNTIDFVELLQQHEPHTGTVDIDVHTDLAHLAYTGGTTGLSKGVELSHANIEANVFQYGNWVSGAIVKEEGDLWKHQFPEGVDPFGLAVQMDREVALIVVPWFHAMGTVGYLNIMVYAGYTMVVLPQFDPKDYLDTIVKYQATYIGGAPQLFIPLVNHPAFEENDLSTVGFVGSGAAPLPVALIEKLTGKFKADYIAEGYGLTEVSMGATMTPPPPLVAKPGSVGLPVFDTQIRIIDTVSGEELPTGQEGEVLIKGPQVMQGYYNRPEATAEVLKDGWLHTGDIGKIDEDGYLFITDRLKDMIIYKGYNVYPRELEEVLFRHEAVEQCAVVGQKNADFGEIPVAFVQLVADKKATKEELIEFVNAQVGGYKKLRDVIMIDAIPVSGAGKILKRELKKQLT